MIKIRVSAYTCKIGDQLAVDIFNEYGTLIVARDTIINASICKSLANMKIDDFWVYRPSYESHTAINDPQLERFYHNYEDKARTLEKLIGNLSDNDQAVENDLDNISDYISNEITYCRDLVKFLYELKSHDDYTFEHSLNVAFYSALICRWMNMNDSKTKNIIKTGLLHDIGKTKVPLDLLNKKGKLHSDELKLIQKHVTYGYNIIKDSIVLDPDIKLGVLLHHEREDGSGYPNNYIGRQLNLNTKIVSISDTYDALTSDRAYRDKYNPFMALDILRKECLVTLDIKIMSTFVDNLMFHYLGSQVLLSSGEIGNVIHIPVNNITRPIVNVNSKLVDLSKENSLDIIGVVNG